MTAPAWLCAAWCCAFGAMLMGIGLCQLRDARTLRGLSASLPLGKPTTAFERLLARATIDAMRHLQRRRRTGWKIMVALAVCVAAWAGLWVRG